ncbi:MAG: aminotransferase class III-fold pyridoxal phosphate-dependent enzyme [Chlamydiia bacterium]|nr:aminotransferase class III-fold pyridoxal phosphate-dependent enzyme [Chlamydiia bacterium]
MTTLLKATQRPQSVSEYQRACLSIPSGVNSPVRAFSKLAISPMVVSSGYGAIIVDIDGNQFIDYCLSWGPLICGHAHPQIVEKVQKKVACGSSFGILTTIEVEIAEKIRSRIESIEKIRFVSSGTEAAMCAAKLARGFTGRELMVKFSGNYHGWSSDFVENTVCLPYNDCDKVYEIFSDLTLRRKIAAVIVEPVGGNMGVVPSSDQFLHLLREETRKNGSLLIFDEVITGFRLCPGGYQNLIGIDPDLTLLGKIVGGGFPGAACGGRAEIMDFLAPQGKVYQAGTLSGNPITMEAGLKTLELTETPGFYERLEMKTKALVDPVAHRLEEKGINACIQRVGSMFTLFLGKRKVTSFQEAQELDFEMFKKWYSFLFERGVYFSPSQQEACFISSAHTADHIEKTRDLLLEMIDDV